MIFKYFQWVKISPSFYFLDVSFWSTKVFNFDETHLSIFSLVAMLLVLYWRNHCLIQGQENLYMFSSKTSIVLAFTSRTLIHFELIFCMWLKVGVQIHSFVLPAPLVLKTVLYPLDGLDTHWNQLTKGVWVYAVNVCM